MYIYKYPTFTLEQMKNLSFLVESNCTINLILFSPDCGNLTDPVNGVLNYTATIYQSIATFTCSLGYYMTGNSTLVCEAGASWNGSEPTCTIYGMYTTCM